MAIGEQDCAQDATIKPDRLPPPEVAGNRVRQWTGTMTHETVQACARAIPAKTPRCLQRAWIRVVPANYFSDLDGKWLVLLRYMLTNRRQHEPCRICIWYRRIIFLRKPQRTLQSGPSAHVKSAAFAASSLRGNLGFDTSAKRACQRENRGRSQETCIHDVNANGMMLVQRIPLPPMSVARIG